jgi:hypothetical protein
LIWFVWFIWFAGRINEKNKTNQINKMNQMNQRDEQEAVFLRERLALLDEQHEIALLGAGEVVAF